MIWGVAHPAAIVWAARRAQRAPLACLPLLQVPGRSVVSPTLRERWGLAPQRGVQKLPASEGLSSELQSVMSTASHEFTNQVKGKETPPLSGRQAEWEEGGGYFGDAGAEKLALNVALTLACH